MVGTDSANLRRHIRGGQLHHCSGGWACSVGTRELSCALDADRSSRRGLLAGCRSGPDGSVPAVSDGIAILAQATPIRSSTMLLVLSQDQRCSTIAAIRLTYGERQLTPNIRHFCVSQHRSLWARSSHAALQRTAAPIPCRYRPKGDFCTLRLQRKAPTAGKQSIAATWR